MVRPLAAHVALGEPVELGMDQRREFFEGLLLAVAPGFKELSKFVSTRLVHFGLTFSHKKAQKAQNKSFSVYVSYVPFCG